MAKTKTKKSKKLQDVKEEKQVNEKASEPVETPNILREEEKAENSSSEELSPVDSEAEAEVSTLLILFLLKTFFASCWMVIEW